MHNIYRMSQIAALTPYFSSVTCYRNSILHIYICVCVSIMNEIDVKFLRDGVLSQEKIIASRVHIPL